MFQSSRERLRAWLSRFDDVLGDPPQAAEPHPHRQPLRSHRIRRAGAVQARPAHCISPVHRDVRHAGHDRAAR
jgi:hypothetical protein